MRNNSIYVADYVNYNGKQFAVGILIAVYHETGNAPFLFYLIFCAPYILVK